MGTPLFSVITATRNMLPYVGQCIRSVTSQDYPVWEMIIVDDCSEDRTFKRACEIAKSFNAKNSSKHIEVVRNDKRLYCGKTYARLLKMASGKYCGVVDGDDILLPEAISRVVGCYEENPHIDFIWTKHNWGNARLEKFRLGLSSFPKKGTIYDSEKGFKHIYSHWRTFKTEMRERGQMFRDLPCTVDKDLGYNLEEHGQGAFFPMSLYNYRYHKDNMSHHSAQKTKWMEVRNWHRYRERRYRIIKL